MQTRLSRTGHRPGLIPAAVLACALAATLAAGCSSGGGSAVAGGPDNSTTSGARNASSGSVAMTLTFPATKRSAQLPVSGSTRTITVTRSADGRTRIASITPAKASTDATSRTRAMNGNIPIGTAVVKVVITDPATNGVLASRLVNAPLINGTLPSKVTVNFAALPAGPVKVDVTAFPDAAAALTPIATGSLTATVVPLVQTDVTVNLTLTLASMSLSPANISTFYDPINPQTHEIHAILLDANEKPVLLPIRWTNSDPGIVSLTIDPNDPYHATVTAIQSGTSTITIYEPNSDRTATAIVDTTG